jgi:DNA-binding NtrC family response regulator
MGQVMNRIDHLRRSTQVAPRSMLIVGVEAPTRQAWMPALGRMFDLLEVAPDYDRADSLLARCHFDVVVVGWSPLDDSVDGWIQRHRATGDASRWIMLADAADERAQPDDDGPEITSVLALPVSAGELAAAAGLDTRLASRARAGRAPVAMSAAARRELRLVGRSPAIEAVRRLINRIAPTSATVLIQGETGTGKELVARLLHAGSRRRGPFVAVNCGAIAPELMESELFGHARGAFTGAHQAREGLFAAASGGTLLLDEVGEMRVDLQVKLLRVLEEGAVRPVGTNREVPMDVRLVASSQPGLADKVERGLFREDLWFRLNVIHLALPPLRERPDDIPALAEYLMTGAARDLGVLPVALSTGDFERLAAHRWDGNVRELRNCIERSVLLGGLELEVEREPANGVAEPPGYPLAWSLERVKREHMQRVLAAAGGSKAEAARRLSISRRTLERIFGCAE